jgi:hypothetical protein
MYHNSDEWIDKQDVMLTLHVSDSTLKRWRRSRVLPFAKVGGKIFYKRADIEMVLRSNYGYLKFKV